jgi:hypothetical protein
MAHSFLAMGTTREMCISVSLGIRNEANYPSLAVGCSFQLSGIKFAQDVHNAKLEQVSENSFVCKVTRLTC